MSYKYSKGSQVIGDLKAADDAERNTLIDFGEDQIEFQTSGSTRLKVDNEGVQVTGSFNSTGDLIIGPQGRSLRISGSAFLSSSTDIYSGNGSGNYSVSLWFKSGNQIDENRIIFTLANSNARSTVREKGGFLQFLASATDNSTCVSAINYYPTEDDNWNFLTFVTRQNGSDIETTASLNGAITDSDTVAGKTGIMNYNNGSVRKLQIGGYTLDEDTISNEIFIRDFILWNGSLSTSEITTLYNSGNYYDFNDFTTHDKLVWIKNNDPIGTSYDESTTIQNFGISGSNFEVAGYDSGEIVEISPDAPFNTFNLLETDFENSSSVTIQGQFEVEGIISSSVEVQAPLGSFDVIDLDRLSLTSTQTSVPPLQLTANSLSDNVGALRIDGSEPDIYLNQTGAAGFTTVTFAHGEQPMVGFGKNSAHNLYFFRETGQDGEPHTYVDTDFVFDRASGDITIGQDLTVNGALRFEDHVMAELSIPGLDLQTDTNAFRFNCPYNLDITELDLYLDQHTTSGNVTVTVSQGGTTMITLSITGTNTSANTTTVTSGSINANDEVTFAITATPANAQGLRANLAFRRRL